MKKSELMELLANKTECEKVSVAGYGTFKISKRSARTGRNPQNGESIQIKASKSVSFKAGAELKNRVN